MHVTCPTSRSRRTPRSRRRTRRGWTRSARSTRRCVLGPAATTCARTASARSCSGVSGGIDSALVAAIAADALGGENVVGVSMPEPLLQPSTPGTTPPTWPSALGLDYRVIPIEPMVERVPRDARADRGRRGEPPGARARRHLMGCPTRRATSSSPPATRASCRSGYSTIYGDSVGGFAPIKDVPKTLVWELARWRNAEAVRRGEPPPIPESTITKPPSAELRPGQIDQDSLPPYEVLDAILDALRRAAPRAAPSSSRPASTRRSSTRSSRLVDRAEWKRRQFAPGPEDLPPGVRPRPSAAGHQPVARAGLLSRARPATRSGLPRRASPGTVPCHVPATRSPSP